MTFLDLFAGIGGFRLALEKAGHTCIGFCEINKFARQVYKSNFNTEGEWEGHDITKVTDEEIKSIGAVDIICGGFPCQAFSIAGNRLGFADTRGTMFFELCRFIKLLQPKIVFCENVKGLLSHDKGRTFFVILNTLGKLGYDVEYQVLNSKGWVPQNRERVYIIGSSRDRSGRKVFPLRRTNCQALKQIVGGKQGERVYDPEGTGLYAIDLSTSAPKITDKARCLTARYAKGVTRRPAEASGVLCLQKTHGSTVTVKNNETGTLQSARLDKVPNIVLPVLTPDRLNKRQNGR